MNVVSLKKYQVSGIEDMGGYVSEEFKQFATTYKRHINKICKANGIELINFNKGHYYCSWFLKKDNHYIYCSFSDVRHFDKSWWNSILYRTAENERDYHGGSNWYTDLDNFENNINRMFARM